MSRQGLIGLIGGLFIVAVVLGGWLWLSLSPQQPVATPEPLPEPERPAKAEPQQPTTKIIGFSVEGRDITATTFGSGDTHLLFVGGMHGGYEWNSSLLAYTFINYFTENPDAVPEYATISIIPNLNPDGLYAATGLEGEFTMADVPNPNERVAAGRFNANDVDLNRNFDCKWAPESTWRGEVVSAGTGAFSEPEAQTLRDYVTEYNPNAVVFWHSQANNVYASECENGVLPTTTEIMNVYANAGEYGAVESFDAYPITGDAEGWLASLGIPAVTVEMETANSIEWNRNLAGVMATLDVFRPLAR